MSIILKFINKKFETGNEHRINNRITFCTSRGIALFLIRANWSCGTLRRNLWIILRKMQTVNVINLIK